VADFISEHLYEILGVVAIVVLISVVSGILRGRRKVFVEGMTLNVRCRKCTWKGTVTRYNQVCRKCGGKDLQVI
jgi:Zn finger protein HypA/HybF involved in hydrogenase expression